MKLRIWHLLTAAVVFVMLTGCAHRETVQMQNPESNMESSSAVSPLKIPSLSMPDEYMIRYEIHNEDGDPETYISEITRTQDGFFVSYGDTGEQNVLLSMNNGRYLICEYEPYTRSCTSTMLTMEIKRLIDAGVMSMDMVTVEKSVAESYAAKMEALLTRHLAFENHLEYLGDETMNGVSCMKYVVHQETAPDSQTIWFWVDSELGLCRKAVYQKQFLNASPETSTMECTLLKTEELSLPGFYFTPFNDMEKD